MRREIANDNCGSSKLMFTATANTGTHQIVRDAISDRLVRDMKRIRRGVDADPPNSFRGE